MYDVRDCINVDWGEDGFVRSRNCQGVVGVTSGYLIDLFGVVTKRVRNVFMGLQSLCQDLNCDNPMCVRNVARNGVSIYNERYPLDRLDIAYHCIGSTHTFLSSGRLNPGPIRCVRPEDRLLSRLTFGVEGFTFETVDSEPNRPIEPFVVPQSVALEADRFLSYRSTPLRAYANVDFPVATVAAVGANRERILISTDVGGAPTITTDGMVSRCVVLICANLKF